MCRVRILSFTLLLAAAPFAIGQTKLPIQQAIENSYPLDQTQRRP